MTSALFSYLLCRSDGVNVGMIFAGYKFTKIVSLMRLMLYTKKQASFQDMMQAEALILKTKHNLKLVIQVSLTQVNQLHHRSLYLQLWKGWNTRKKKFSKSLVPQRGESRVHKKPGIPGGSAM